MLCLHLEQLVLGWKYVIKDEDTSLRRGEMKICKDAMIRETKKLTIT